MADFRPNFVAGFPVLIIQSNTMVFEGISGRKRRVNSRQFVDANIGPGLSVASGSKAAPPNQEARAYQTSPSLETTAQPLGTEKLLLKKDFGQLRWLKASWQTSWLAWRTLVDARRPSARFMGGGGRSTKCLNILDLLKDHPRPKIGQ